MNASSRGFSMFAMLACMASLPSMGAELRPYPFPALQAEPRIEQQMAAAIGILGAVAGYLFGPINRGKSGTEEGEGKLRASMSMPTGSGGAGGGAIPQRSRLLLTTED